MPPPPLSYGQAAPARQAQSRRHTQENIFSDPTHTVTIPPHLPLNDDRSIRTASIRQSRGNQQTQMPPPPVPGPSRQIQRQHANINASRHPSTPRRGNESEPTFQQRFDEPTALRAISNGGDALSLDTRLQHASSLATQRFMPSTPSGQQRFGTSAPVSVSNKSKFVRSTAVTGLHSSRAAGGQRVPFVPGGQSGFG
ncbi:hypothetical protein PHLCEN_2v8710 [Hermanssonia centrifuga]|uniref:Uncharacterized protein n=1 Tax=Hermanssonia centrifuga TaxID=98765 RepID=A0A2R6NSX9_9APHY|nr:hypothetical protein PHLCEN_2v8710 [Hermanssonia centrifuga]